MSPLYPALDFLLWHSVSKLYAPATMDWFVLAGKPSPPWVKINPSHCELFWQVMCLSYQTINTTRCSWVFYISLHLTCLCILAKVSFLQTVLHWVSLLNQNENLHLLIGYANHAPQTYWLKLCTSILCVYSYFLMAYFFLPLGFSKNFFLNGACAFCLWV